MQNENNPAIGFQDIVWKRKQAHGQAVIQMVTENYEMHPWKEKSLM